MAEVIAEWAGKERLFRLTFGGVLDLEEACGKQAIGSIFVRMGTGQFFAREVYEVLRLSLIGGGMKILEAKQLMDNHFDESPYVVNASIAGDVLIALMAGVEDGGSSDASEPEAMKFSEVSQICREFHMSPQDLRDMTYADFVNMVRGFNAASKTKAEHITEEEFEDILSRYEPEALG